MSNLCWGEWGWKQFITGVLHLRTATAPKTGINVGKLAKVYRTTPDNHLCLWNSKAIISEHCYLSLYFEKKKKKTLSCFLY